MIQVILVFIVAMIILWLLSMVLVGLFVVLKFIKFLFGGGKQ